MNYYAARQRETDGRWDWTQMNDGHIWATGACADNTCMHATKEEAEPHEQERVHELIRNAERSRLDTFYGYRCPAEGCEEKAFYEARVPGRGMYIACDAHLDQPELWYHVTQITSSY